MSLESHRLAIENARRTTEGRNLLASKIGNKSLPNTEILQAYTQAKSALQSNLSDFTHVNSTMTIFRAQVARISSKTLLQAHQLGVEDVNQSIRIYPELLLPASIIVPPEPVEVMNNQLDAQVAAVLAMSQGGNDEDLILGTDSRVGIFNSTTITRPLDNWAQAMVSITIGILLGIIFFDNQPELQTEFGFQAIATIDRRTTLCCLLVNGQVRELDGLFKLTGTPRFADEMQRPPFHNFCRTSAALIRLQDEQDSLTKALLLRSKIELAQR